MFLTFNIILNFFIKQKCQINAPVRHYFFFTFWCHRCVFFDELNFKWSIISFWRWTRFLQIMLSIHANLNSINEVYILMHHYHRDHWMFACMNYHPKFHKKYFVYNLMLLHPLSVQFWLIWFCGAIICLRICFGWRTHYILNISLLF